MEVYPDPKVHVNIIRSRGSYKIQVFSRELEHLEEARYESMFDALDAVKKNGCKLACFVS
jgi:hypothetical protein